MIKASDPEGRKVGIKLEVGVTEGLPNGNLQKGRVYIGIRRRDRSRSCIPDTMDKIFIDSISTRVRIVVESAFKDAVTQCKCGVKIHHHVRGNEQDRLM